MAEQQNQAIQGIFRQNPRVSQSLQKIQNNALEFQSLIQRMQSRRHQKEQSAVPEIHDISQIKYLNQYDPTQKEKQKIQQNESKIMQIKRQDKAKKIKNQLDDGDFQINKKYLSQTRNNRVSLDLKRILTKKSHIDKEKITKSEVNRSGAVRNTKNKPLVNINQDQREHSEGRANESTNKFQQRNNTNDSFRIKKSINRFTASKKQQTSQFKQSRVSCSSRNSSNHQFAQVLKRQSKQLPPQNAYQNQSSDQNRLTDRSLKNGSRPYFQSQMSFKANQVQNKIEQEKSFSSKRILNINPHQLSEYIGQLNQTPNDSQPPRKLFQFFNALVQKFQVPCFKDPMIKKYRNCIYYGEKNKQQNQSRNTNTHSRFRINPQNHRYQGFLWYYRKAIYYGEFFEGKKDGQGIQIDLRSDQNQTIWKGYFTNGTKTGYFKVRSSAYQYKGNLKNGYYHGQGNLKTEEFEYKGQFRAGVKQGYGQQTIKKGRNQILTYKGQFSGDSFEGRGQLRGQNFYYKGQFKNGFQQGTGFQKNHQYQFSGEFNKGQKVGAGTFKYSDGSVIEGYFRHGTFIENVKVKEKANALRSSHSEQRKYSNQNKKNSKGNPQRSNMRQTYQNVLIKMVPETNSNNKFSNIYSKYVANSKLEALQQQSEEVRSIQQNSHSNKLNEFSSKLSSKASNKKEKMKPSSIPMSIVSYPKTRNSIQIRKQYNSDQEQPLFQRIVEF